LNISSIDSILILRLKLSFTPDFEFELSKSFDDKIDDLIFDLSPFDIELLPLFCLCLNFSLFNLCFSFLVNLPVFNKRGFIVLS